MASRRKYNRVKIAVVAGVVGLLFLVGSCSGGNGTQANSENPASKGQLKSGGIIGSWHSVRLQNDDLDSFYARAQHYIDTFGKNNTDAINLRVYKTTNVDSLRRLTQAQFDSSKNLQQQEVMNTTLIFRPDNTVYLSFNGALDTSKWSLGPDDMLTLEDMNAGTEHDKLTWEVTELTDTSLVVKMKKDSSYSKVTFHPEGK